MKSLPKLQERQLEYMHLLGFFISAGVNDIKPSNSFNTTVVVCGWGNHVDKSDKSYGLKGIEICAMVDSIMGSYPGKLKYFTMYRSCNCIQIEHADIFDDD